jgi:hypothetical protein
MATRKSDVFGRSDGSQRLKSASETPPQGLASCPVRLETLKTVQDAVPAAGRLRPSVIVVS